MEDDIKLPEHKLALYGKNCTENLGIERIVLNVVSNPNIRFLIVCGREIKGHKAGQALVALWKNGLDDKNRIVGAEGAIPYVQNIPRFFVDRFRRQVEVVDLIGEVDCRRVSAKVAECVSACSDPYVGEDIDFSKYLFEPEVVSSDLVGVGRRVCVSPEHNVNLSPKSGRITLD